VSSCRRDGKTEAEEGSEINNSAAFSIKNQQSARIIRLLSDGPVWLDGYYWLNFQVLLIFGPFLILSLNLRVHSLSKHRSILSFIYIHIYKYYFH
jgi:hypothetical protein